jgi:hypothetical protein
MSRREYETKLMQVRQSVRELLDAVIGKPVIDMAQYRKLKVRVEVCNELLKESRLSQAPIGQKWNQNE